jgi:hypothetical protein
VGLFSRKPIASGTFRVTGVTRVDGAGQLVLNGMPQLRLHVSGILQAEGMVPEAFSVEQHFGMDDAPVAGAEVPADVLKLDPVKARIHWATPRVDQHVTALRDDADAEVIQQLLTSGRAEHAPGKADPVGIALTDPSASTTIADQLAAAMGTPLTVDVDENGVKKRITVGGGGHLSSAEAAELQRTGSPATATVVSATRVNIPEAMMPPGASLWDLDLTVARTDHTTYEAQTRVAFRTDARRQALGVPGLSIPVRIDPADDGRVAVDSATYDAQHPDAPARL